MKNKLHLSLIIRSLGIAICLLTVIAVERCPADNLTNDYYFTHLNTANTTLSFNKVHIVRQDSNGFIWLGTSDGLNRFDGRTFKTYYRDDLGLDTSFVTTLCPDTEGNVWVGTDSGLTVYDYQSDSFRPLLVKSDIGTHIHNKVNYIYVDKANRVWLSVLEQGLFCYDQSTQTLTNYFFKDGKLTLPYGIRSFYIDAAGELWLSIYFNGLYRVDKTFTTIEPINVGDDGRLFHNDDIIAITRHPYANTILVVSTNIGLCEIDPRTNKVNALLPIKNGYLIESMFVDKQKRIWLATTDGIYCHHIPSGNTEHIVQDANNSHSLSDMHCYSVFVDDAEGLWVGTNSNGVDYCSAFQSNFEKYFKADNISLNRSLVRNFAKDTDGLIWITTEGEGLFVYNPNSKLLTKYSNKNLPDVLFGICTDNDYIWIGTFLGLCRLKPSTGQVKFYSRFDEESQIRDNKIYSIIKSSSNDIYMGTTLGLYRYVRNSDSFVLVDGFNGVFVNNMFEDNAGSIWLSSYANGLFMYNPKTGEIVNYSKERPDPYHLPINKMLSVYEDIEGRIWVTSFGAGFFMKGPNETAFSTFDRREFPKLPSDIYYMAIEDDANNLWLSSNKGLVCFNVLSSDMRVYSKTDGLLDDDFNYNSAIKLSDGSMLFGSSNGFIRFDSGKFDTDNATPKVTFSDFWIDEEVVKPSEKCSIRYNINESDHIVIPAGTLSFGFDFSLMGFFSPASATILCKLEGYDSDWVGVTDGRMIYTNVPAGRYKLSVKSVNENGLWSEPGRPKEILVREKFYRSSLAIILYLLLSFSVIVLLINYLYRRARNREKRANEEYKRAKEQELFQEKMMFFTNIIHDIKTPLTLIKTPLQNILASNSFDKSTTDDLTVINNSTEYLDSLVKELLDFVRVEEHGYVLEKKRLDLIETVGFLCFNFSEAAKSNNLRLTFHHNDEQIFINADESVLNKILYNLIHNAVKYAESYIEINAELGDDSVIMTFRNDGPPIPADKRNDIFKPFVQYGNDRQPSSQSFGIGLFLARTFAEMHEGRLLIDETDHTATSFVLTLPVGLSDATVSESVETDCEAISDEDSLVPTLLVVEDNVELLEYLKRKLEPDYRILVSQSAERAVTIIERRNVDLLITDISLRGMSGIELCRQVCSNFENSHVPVIILSAISKPEYKIKCMECGASLYIEKPFSLEYLQACLKIELEKRRSMREAYLSSIAPDAKNYSLPGSDEEFMRNLDSVILQNIADPGFTNDRLAASLYVTRSTLIRKIKGLLDTTPNDYIRSKRLNLAAQMLTRNHCRINEVCYAVGFNTPSYFTKCFKRHYGVLPAEYMNSHNVDAE